MEPEIILMDLNLERGSGIEATEAIDALETDHGIVVSTVDVGGETRSRAMAAGADAYLTKPYSQDALLDAIERVLS
jgi:two-component system chemotaxis response regulator CheY